MTDHMAEATTVLAAAFEPDSPPDAAALIAQLVSANYRDYARTTQMLIENLQPSKSLIDSLRNRPVES